MMKRNNYESVVIVNAALEDTQIEETLRRIEETIKHNGGEITDADKWGRKRLAYPIQKSKSGYYCVYRFVAPTDLIHKLERAYRLDETVIRYMTIVLDKEALESIAKEKEAAAKIAADVTPEVTDSDTNKNDSQEKITN
ncbi:MAG: 30S ribosomal protein S6 [bacterium]